MNEEHINEIARKHAELIEQDNASPSANVPTVMGRIAQALRSMLPPPGSVLTADGSVLEAAFDQRVAQTHGRSNDGQWYNVPIFFPYPAAQAELKAANDNAEFIVAHLHQVVRLLREEVKYSRVHLIREEHPDGGTVAPFYSLNTHGTQADDCNYADARAAVDDAKALADPVIP